MDALWLEHRPIWYEPPVTGGILEQKGCAFTCMEQKSGQTCSAKGYSGLVYTPTILQQILTEPIVDW